MVFDMVTELRTYQGLLSRVTVIVFAGLKGCPELQRRIMVRYLIVVINLCRREIGSWVRVAR